MRTLHKLFHENLFKKWLFALVISLVGGLLISKGIQKKIDNRAGNLFFVPAVLGTCPVKAQSPFIIYNLYYIQQLFYSLSLTSGENHPTLVFYG